MRNAFAEEITKQAQVLDNLILLSGDIGNRLFDKFKEQATDRFINCGVAEANMTGVAAGLAQSGFRVVTYTIAAFNTFRCIEQIKIDICYQNLPVIIVGVGAGLSYAGLGATHHSCEDIAMLRSIPNLQVLCPGDPLEVRLALRSALKSDMPSYIRLGKKGEKLVHDLGRSEDLVTEFKIGKGLALRRGRDISLISTGTTLPLAAEVADCLEKQRIGCDVFSFHTVKPLDRELLGEIVEQGKQIVTIEEHSRIGGLGAAVSEYLTENSFSSIKLLSFGTEDRFMKGSGNQKNARILAGLTTENIAAKITDWRTKA